MFCLSQCLSSSLLPLLLLRLSWLATKTFTLILCRTVSLQDAHQFYYVWFLIIEKIYYIHDHLSAWTVVKRCCHSCKKLFVRLFNRPWTHIDFCSVNKAVSSQCSQLSETVKLRSHPRKIALHVTCSNACSSSVSNLAITKKRSRKDSHHHFWFCKLQNVFVGVLCAENRSMRESRYSSIQL